jgi:hypothetical protein
MPQAAYVKIDIEKTIREVSSLAEKQVPYAMAQTFTALAKGSQAAIRAGMPARFTIRSRWEQMGVRIEPARKADVKSTGSCEAIVKDIDPYMTRQEKGGIKSVRGKRLAIPERAAAAAMRSGSGAIAKKWKPGELLKDFGKERKSYGRRGTHRKPKPFIIARGGSVAIAIRRLDGRYPLKYLYTLVPQAHVKPRFDFEKTVRAFVAQNYEKTFAANLEAAIKSAH